jgi:GH24 family phage-related lysozyme (muramidase)
MIAIGAQVKGGNTQGTSANTLLDFNNGLEDRIIPKKLEPFTSISSNFDSKYEKLKNNINKIKSFFLPLPKDAPPANSDGTPASTNQASNSEYKSSLKDLIIYFQEIGETNTNGRSIIPVQISLTMDGIGGLIIGHLFKIPPDLLPRGYGSDNIGGRLIQTITAINHKVENGDWTTTIDALNIVTKDSLNDRKKLKFNDLLTERKDSFAIKALEPPNVTGSYFDRATNFIKKFEGFLSTPQPDSDGKLRGGYGSPVKWDKEGSFSGMVNDKTTFTEEEATYTLKYNIQNTYEPLAKNAIGIETWVKLTDNQKAALISYVYNTGTERLKDKNITQYLKEGNYKEAAAAIKSGPITAKNKKGIREEVPGLVTRRQQESILFLTP